jgi:hypothetical protein
VGSACRAPLTTNHRFGQKTYQIVHGPLFTKTHVSVIRPNTASWPRLLARSYEVRANGAVQRTITSVDLAAYSTHLYLLLFGCSCRLKFYLGHINIRDGNLILFTCLLTTLMTVLC